MENAQNLMYFVQNRIMSDYVGFEGATDTYYEKAEHMDSVMAVLTIIFRHYIRLWLR